VGSVSTAIAGGTLQTRVREVLAAHARLAIGVEALDPEADLFSAGMSSHASVNVMLALEDVFDVEFPDSMLKRRAFGSIAAISAAIAELQRIAA
jgi:acyl carrier protein